MPKPAEVTPNGDRGVRVTRHVNAPSRLVFDEHTRPELVQRWLTGYPGWDMSVCEIDARVGGNYKWQWRNQEDGKVFGFFGTFTEVNAPSRVAYKEYYDPGDMDYTMPVGDPCIVSLDLTEHDGVTTLVCTMTFASADARDEAVASGMTDGMEYSYTCLDELFAKQAA